jgi:hypothetical protein
MLDEVYRLERAAWAGNEAVSMWNHRLLQENSQLRKWCQHLQGENDRARRLLKDQLARSSNDLVGSNQEHSKCDRCGLTSPNVHLTPCFHRFCSACDGGQGQGAAHDVIRICKLCFPSGLAQPECT